MLRCAAGIHVSNVTYQAYHLHLPHAKHTNSSCQLHQRMKSGAESLMERKKGKERKKTKKENTVLVQQKRAMKTEVSQTFPVDLFLHVQTPQHSDASKLHPNTGRRKHAKSKAQSCTTCSVMYSVSCMCAGVHAPYLEQCFSRSGVWFDCWAGS